MASSLTMGLLLVASLLLLLRHRASRNAVAREIVGDEEGTRRPATQSPENTGGRRGQDGLCGPVTTPIAAFSLVLIAVGVLMEELAPGKGCVRAGLVPCLLKYDASSPLFCSASSFFRTF
nr:uncharacterized protein LOC117859558 [Setaria viridis]